LIVTCSSWFGRIQSVITHIKDPKLGTIKATINFATFPAQFKLSDPRLIGGERFGVPSLVGTQKSSQQPFRRGEQNMICAQDGQKQTNKHYYRLPPAVMSDQKLHRVKAGDKECRPSITNKN